MESKQQYEKSYKEVTRFIKTLSDSSATIDFTKLDGETAGLLRSCIKETMQPRLNKLNNIISGANYS